METVRAWGDKTPGIKSMRRPYDSKIGVFPSRSVNLGLRSTSCPHTDDKNLAQSWCSITPIGHFNAQKGGHLILWDLGLVIDFPAGSTALIPSALVLHSNTSIGDEETRFSIVQYAAGGLFRWVNNGLMTDKQKQEGMVVDEQEEELEAGVNWRKAMGMFTRVSELQA